jgi:predicted DNA-binding ribbon-helix-helix protein
MARKKRLAMARHMMHANVHIGERRTSVSLDPVVWQSVCEIAAHQGKTETQLLAEINRARGALGLSVAIRRFVVEFYRARIELPPRR